MSLQNEQQSQQKCKSVHQKFNEAFENMQSFHQLIQKFSTNRGARYGEENRSEIHQFNQRRQSQGSQSRKDELKSYKQKNYLNKNKQWKSVGIQKMKSKQNIKSSQNLDFGNGWSYSGDIIEGKFHGFGILSLKGETLYSGQFRQGQFHGRGKLYYSPNFQEIIDCSLPWQRYEGQFHYGSATGFGNLHMIAGGIRTGYWNQGRSNFTTLTQSLIN